MRGGAVRSQSNAIPLEEPPGAVPGVTPIAPPAAAHGWGRRQQPAAAPAAPRAESMGADGRSFTPVAPIIAIVLLAFFAARLTELVPALRVVRPTLLLSVIGASWVVFRSGATAARGVFTNKVFQTLLFYGAVAVLTAPFAIWPNYALQNAVSLFTPAILLCIILLLCQPTAQNLDRITYGFVVSVLLQLVGVFAYGVIRGENRLSGTDSLDPNDLAALCALTFPFALGHVFRRRGRHRIVPLVAAAMMLVALIRTGSRGGTLAFLVCAIVYTASQPGARRIGMALVFVVAGALGWFLGPPEYRERMATLTELDKDYNEFAYEGRKAIRERAQDYFLENPLVGVGMANFELAEGRRMRSEGLTGKWSAPHNAYWQAFAELGFFGGMAFVVLLGRAAQSGWQLWRPRLRNGYPNALHRPEFLASLAAFAVAAYFLSHAYFWTMFGLVGLLAYVDSVVRAGGTMPNVAPAAPATGATAVVPRGRGSFSGQRGALRS